MRNRAKCRLCNDVIESFCGGDYVECKCGEIAVVDGFSCKCAARNWENFIRVDDEDNEIVVSVKEKESSEDNTQLEKPKAKPTKREIIELLKDQIRSLEALPPQAMSTYINHYDWSSLLTLLAAALEAMD